MTNNLGLDALTDDQLVELVREIGIEMTRRNPSVLDASKNALIQAVEKAAKSQDNIWSLKKWLATMVTSHVGAKFSLNVWQSRDGDDVRVYLEKQPERKRDSGIKYCYYVTGNNRHPPKCLTLEGKSEADAEIVKIICETAFATFPDGTQINCDQAAKLDYTIPENPPALTERATKLDTLAHWQKRYDEYRAEIYSQEIDPLDKEEEELKKSLGVAYLPMAGDEYKDRRNRWRQAHDRLQKAMELWENQNPKPEL